MTNKVTSQAEYGSSRQGGKRNQPKQRKHKYKHVKSKPISLTEVGEGSFQQHLTSYISKKDVEENEETKMLLRIEKMNQRKMQKTAQEVNKLNEGVEEWQKKTALNHVSFIREQKKEEIIDEVIKNHKTMEKDLLVTPGEPSFFSILMMNSSRRSEVYSVKFEDPDEQIIKDPEISIVQNSDKTNEWKYWSQNGK